MIDLLLVRHGECGTTSNDDFLTPLGEWQAQQVGLRLATTPITAIVSSPLVRALGTANIIARELENHAFEVWPTLREGLYKPLHGYGRTAVLTRFPLAVLPSTLVEESWHYNDDTQESMFQRCQQTLQALHERFTADSTVVVVAHGGIINYLLHVILHISPGTPSWFALSYAAITHLRFLPPEKPIVALPLYPAMDVEIIKVNDTTHLLPDK